MNPFSKLLGAFLKAIHLGKPEETEFHVEYDTLKSMVRNFPDTENDDIKEPTANRWINARSYLNHVWLGNQEDSFKAHDISSHFDGIAYAIKEQEGSPTIKLDKTILGYLSNNSLSILESAALFHRAEIEQVKEGNVIRIQPKAEKTFTLEEDVPFDLQWQQSHKPERLVYSEKTRALLDLKEQLAAYFKAHPEIGASWKAYPYSNILGQKPPLPENDPPPPSLPPPDLY